MFRRVTGSPSKESTRQPKADALPWRATEGRKPDGWNGAPMGDPKPSLHSFPCIGRECVARDAWYDEGTQCQAYKDLAMNGRRGQWQHGCISCTAQAENQWPKLHTAQMDPANPSRGTSTGGDDWAAWSSEEVALLASYEASSDSVPRVSDGRPAMPAAHTAAGTAGSVSAVARGLEDDPGPSAAPSAAPSSAAIPSADAASASATPSARNLLFKPSCERCGRQLENLRACCTDCFIGHADERAMAIDL